MADKKYATISIRISAEDKEALLKYGEAHDMTVSQIMRKSMKAFLKIQEEKEKKKEKK